MFSSRPQEIILIWHARLKISEEGLLWTKPTNLKQSGQTNTTWKSKKCNINKIQPAKEEGNLNTTQPTKQQDRTRKNMSFHVEI